MLQVKLLSDDRFHLHFDNNEEWVQIFLDDDQKNIHHDVDHKILLVLQDFLQKQRKLQILSNFIQFGHKQSLPNKVSG